MRKITAKELKKAGNMYCSYCRPGKVPAVYRKDGMCNHATDFACEVHKHNILQLEEHRKKSDDLSEADYQTWMRL